MISYYNTCPQKNQAGEVIKELIDAKNIAIENIERVIGRDEKLNIIAVKSEALNNQSRNINFIAQQIKKQARMKQIKTMIIVGISIVVVVLIFIFMIF
jgi:ABC-type Fe3+-siderophore transport system permease subunit